MTHHTSLSLQRPRSKCKVYYINEKSEKTLPFKTWSDIAEFTQKAVNLSARVSVILGFLFFIVYCSQIHYFPDATLANLTQILFAISAISIFWLSIILFILITPAIILYSQDDVGISKDSRAGHIAAITYTACASLAQIATIAWIIPQKRQLSVNEYVFIMSCAAIAPSIIFTCVARFCSSPKPHLISFDQATNFIAFSFALLLSTIPAFAWATWWVATNEVSKQSLPNYFTIGFILFVGNLFPGLINYTRLQVFSVLCALTCVALLVIAIGPNEFTSEAMNLLGLGHIEEELVITSERAKTIPQSDITGLSMRNDGSAQFTTTVLFHLGGNVLVEDSKTKWRLSIPESDIIEVRDPAKAAKK